MELSDLSAKRQRSGPEPGSPCAPPPPPPPPAEARRPRSAGGSETCSSWSATKDPPAFDIAGLGVSFRRWNGRAVEPADDLDLESNDSMASFPFPAADPVMGLAGVFGARSARPKITWKGGDLPYLYEVWHETTAQSRFLCGGRCFSGPNVDLAYRVFTWSFILFPSGLFFLYPAGYVKEELGFVFVLATAGLLVLTVLLLCLTGHTDPGLIPRPKIQLSVPGLEQRTADVAGTPPLYIDELSGELLCPISEEHIRLGYRWCTTCHIVRPPRASHCNDCNSCVLRYDHHCPFVNNCIGQRNYMFFLGFLASTLALGSMMLFGTWVWYWGSADTAEMRKSKVTAAHITLILTCAATAVLLLGVFALGAFHVVLFCWGRTTKEALTGRTPPRHASLRLGSRTPLAGSAAALAAGLVAMASSAGVEDLEEGLGVGGPSSGAGPIEVPGAAARRMGPWYCRELQGRRAAPCCCRQASLVPARERVSHYPLRMP